MPKFTTESAKHFFKDKVDPWNFTNSPYEKGRFEKMLAVVKTVPHKKILEIGCAEGHFTKMLLTISTDVTAIDVSQDAIKRAKKRAPGAKYINTSIDKFDLAGKKFDITIASEVIYYVENKRATFEKIKKSADYLLMCNYFIWDYILARYLIGTKLIKTLHHARLTEALKYCRISLWKIKS